MAMGKLALEAIKVAKYGGVVVGSVVGWEGIKWIGRKVRGVPEEDYEEEEDGEE